MPALHGDTLLTIRQGPQSVAMTRWDEVVDQVPRNDASKRLLPSTRLQHACGGVRASVMGSRHTCTLCAVQLQPLQCSSSSCNALAYPTLCLRSGQLPLAHDGTCEDVCKHAAYEHAAYGAELGVKIHCCVSCTPSALSGACSRPVGFCCDEANARPGGLMRKCYYHDMQQCSIHAWAAPAWQEVLAQQWNVCADQFSTASSCAWPIAIICLPLTCGMTLSRWCRNLPEVRKRHEQPWTMHNVVQLRFVLQSMLCKEVHRQLSACPHQRHVLML